MNPVCLVFLVVLECYKKIKSILSKHSAMFAVKRTQDLFPCHNRVRDPSLHYAYSLLERLFPAPTLDSEQQL